MAETTDLETVKKLLILQLLHGGVPIEYIAKATGIKAKTIRNMFPLKKLKEEKRDGKKAK